MSRGHSAHCSLEPARVHRENVCVGDVGRGLDWTPASTLVTVDGAGLDLELWWGQQERVLSQPQEHEQGAGWGCLSEGAGLKEGRLGLGLW